MLVSLVSSNLKMRGSDRYLKYITVFRLLQCSQECRLEQVDDRYFMA